MKDMDGLDVSLMWQGLAYEELRERSQDQLTAATDTSRNIDRLEERLSAFGLGREGDTTPIVSPRVGVRGPGTGAPDRDWAELVAHAGQQLAARGVDPTAIDVAALIDEAESRRIEQRMLGGFQVQSSLDSGDVLAAVAAGVVAALADVFVVRIPRNASWEGEVQKGSALTQAMRSYAIENDNWMARYAKVSYDGISAYSKHIAGFGGTTHRVQTFGHDPLIGLVYGTIDIMRGTITATSKTGEVVALGTNVPAVPSLPIAFATQLIHLLSDLPTRTGLPLPGWTALLSVSAGSYGPKEQTIGEIARVMYLRGFDTWHFMTMASSVAAAELVLRGYWGLRGHVDEAWFDATGAESDQTSGARVGHHPRFQTMSLIAHSIAAGSNAGKIVLYQGNPVALNYSQWLWFARSFTRWYAARLASPTELLLRRAAANARALDDAWPLVDADDAGFPELSSSTIG